VCLVEASQHRPRLAQPCHQRRADCPSYAPVPLSRRILRECSFLGSCYRASCAKRTDKRRSLAGCRPFPAPSVIWQVACIGERPLPGLTLGRTP
jgi:hypothetical protein